jgi:hypothetical protein
MSRRGQGAHRESVFAIRGRRGALEGGVDGGGRSFGRRSNGARMPSSGARTSRRQGQPGGRAARNGPRARTTRCIAVGASGGSSNGARTRSSGARTPRRKGQPGGRAARNGPRARTTRCAAAEALGGGSNGARTSGRRVSWGRRRSELGEGANLLGGWLG